MFLCHVAVASDNILGVYTNILSFYENSVSLNNEQRVSQDDVYKHKILRT